MTGIFDKDFFLEGVRVDGRDGPVDILVERGLIAAIGAGIASDRPRFPGKGRFAFGGFIDCHIHLDKANILARCPICEGTLQEAVRLTAAAKAGFADQDVSERASRVVEKAIGHGTNRMRSFVEIDPRAGFRSLEGLLAVKSRYGWAIDIELCAFAQEGTTQEPETLAMLDEALRAGAQSLGGCPYTDSDPVRHLTDMFDLAEKRQVRLDFHADFDLDPKGSILPEITRQTTERGFQGKVSVGHVTKLSAMASDEVDRMAEGLASAGIAVTVLPSTDLFLAGRGEDAIAPRGVAPVEHLRRAGVLVTLATNNVMNPFTPYGDASLMRMANLHANIAQLARDEELSAAFDMAGRNAARLLGLDNTIAVGQPADIVLVEAPDAATAVREIAPVAAGWKAGRQTFVREPVRLLKPQEMSPK